jgi:hypothetical protein
VKPLGILFVEIKQGRDAVIFNEPDLLLSPAEDVVFPEIADNGASNPWNPGKAFRAVPEYSFHSTAIGYQFSSRDIADPRYQGQRNLM